MSQCTAVDLNARHLYCRMSAEDGAKLPQGVEDFRFEEPFGLQCDIKRLHTMPFAKYKPVAVRCLRVVGVNTPHDVEIECCHHIKAGEVTPYVPCLGLEDHLHKPFPVFFCQQCKLSDFHLLCVQLIQF